MDENVLHEIKRDLDSEFQKWIEGGVTDFEEYLDKYARFEEEYGR